MNKISSEDARLVISKWKNESSSLAVVLADNGEADGFASCVIDLQENLLILARNSSSGIWLSLPDAVFEYSDPREAPEPIRGRSSERFVSCLQISWRTGAKCLLYELAEPISQVNYAQ